MFPLKTTHQSLQSFLYSQTTPLRSSHSLPVRLRAGFPAGPARLGSCLSPNRAPTIPCSARPPGAPGAEASAFLGFGEDDEEASCPSKLEDLSARGEVYRKTLALVECSMFSALTGLVYFLSNSLAIENYFGCFFSLPIVISSMRWGISAGRKTMVATTMLLLVLSGPVKALTYLLKHGIVGFTMGALWRSGADWNLSILLCTIVRALGAVGYVLISSFLIRENILALITINIHASLTFLFTAAGVYTIPTMNAIYTIFGILVFLNSGSFIFLLHLLYAVFLTRLGMRASLRMPKWLEKAI